MSARHGPTAAEIARALGRARRVTRGWWSCRCPTHDDRSPSLSLRDGDRGVIVVCHAGCSPVAILTELRRRGLLGGHGAYRSPPRRLITRDDQGAARRVEIARRIWTAAGGARGSPVESYLAGRGIIIAPPLALRWARSLRRPDGTIAPAMIARVDDRDGRMIGVHRTWLARDHAGIWRRRDRASLGPIAGGAVRLAPAAGTLMIAEGIETALAAMQATAQPAWAALSTSGLVGLALPAIVRHVVILADHDVSGAGERAARTAAARWIGEGRRVRIPMPPEPGTDMADVLAGCRYAEIRGVAG